MADPLFEQLALLLSGALMLAAPLSIAFAYQNYTKDQRLRAGYLYHSYLFGVTCVSIIGTASLVWILTEGLPTMWVFVVLPLVHLPIHAIQWRLHKEMDYTGWLGTA